MYDLKVLAAPDLNDDNLRNRVSHRVRGALAERTGDVARVVVRLEQYHAPGGLRVPACRIWLERVDGRVVRAQGRGRSHAKSIDRASARLQVALERMARADEKRASGWTLTRVPS